MPEAAVSQWFCVLHFRRPRARGRCIASYLFVEILLSREVGNGRIDATPEILQHHVDGCIGALAEAIADLSRHRWMDEATKFKLLAAGISALLGVGHLFGCALIFLRCRALSCQPNLRINVSIAISLSLG